MCTYRIAARNMGGSFVFVTDALQHSATNALPCGYPAAALIRANGHTLECPMRGFKFQKNPSARNKLMTRCAARQSSQMQYQPL